ncbi:hypothetical protein RCIP0012_00039 [Klebsiella phage RCIP0012]|uniref:Uncharacterized protein n=1 Tax=Klebsiella phage May TaxID=2054272 RepID=A0A2H5BNU9_9CAUD|nr:hypothetical protein HOS53_gp149 [Klebsiella phage May]AUG88011.1 hypothetical protein CPT_May_097 [Klebsiella phage May]
MSNRNGIKLTPDVLKSHIAEVIYEDREVGGHRVITCHFKMDNGFVVWGKNSSTSIDPTNFDEELGKKLAYDKTFSQLWELEAYRAMVVKDFISKTTEEPFIKLEKYIEDSRTIRLSIGPDYREGVATAYSIRSIKSNKFGLLDHIDICLYKTDNKRHDEIKNSEAIQKAKDFIRSHMDYAEINSEFVIHIAKLCWAARSAVVDTTPSWETCKETDRQDMCDTVKKLLLSPSGYQPNDNLLKLFWAIVSQFR